MKIINKILLLIIITSISLGVMFVLIVRPALKEIKEINEQVYSVKKDLEIKYQRGQSIKKTAQDLKKIEPAMSQFSSAYIQEGEELKFITTLELLAQQNYLEQNIDLQLKKPATAAKVMAVPIQISLTGDFIYVLKYISALEQSDYYLNLNDFIFRAADSVQYLSAEGESLMTAGRVNALLKGNVYWQIKPSL